MSCSFSLDGNQCATTDPDHFDLHRTADGERFSDKQSDQAQPKAA